MFFKGLFAAANIFSNLKLVYIFSVNPYLGPLQVSLSRMVMDILKFITLFVLVLFAFSCGKKLYKILSFLEACFDLIRSPSLSINIQIMGGKITEILGFKSPFRKVKKFLERGFEPHIFSNFTAHDLNFHGK